MKLAPYPEYKPSGIKWLGDVPEHWDVKQLRRVARLQSGVSITSEEMQEGGNYPVYGGNGIRGFTTKFTHRGEFVLIGRQGALCGNINYASSVFWASEHAVVVTPTEKWSTRWMGELLKAMDLNQYSQSAAQPGLSVDRILALPVPVPPNCEQQAIAEFLDYKNAKINALVEKKRALIERLKEKRTALISRTVTRGLPLDAAVACGFNPHPKLNHTEIEWLGDVPEHWEIKQLKRAITFQRGHDLPADQREVGSVPLVSSSGIAATHSCAKAYGPGIVTGRYGTIGEFYLITEDYWPLNTTLYSIDLHGNEPRFLQALLRHLSPLFSLHAVKSAVPGVDRNDIHPIKVVVPPLVEQEAIANFLARETAKVDSIVAKIETAIERLQEYRAAQITAAVTGKIDVRRAVS